MADVARITPQEAHARVSSGQALLVCAYDDPARFAALRLEGAISIQEFRARRAAAGSGDHLLLRLKRGGVLRRSGG